MSLFHSILSQLQQNISKRHANMDMVATTISELLGVSINADQLLLKHSILIIRAAPTLKMVLKLKQQALITALAAKGVKVTTIQ